MSRMHIMVDCVCTLNGIGSELCVYSAFYETLADLFTCVIHNSTLTTLLGGPYSNSVAAVIDCGNIAMVLRLKSINLLICRVMNTCCVLIYTHLYYNASGYICVTTGHWHNYLGNGACPFLTLLNRACIITGHGASGECVLCVKILIAIIGSVRS